MSILKTLIETARDSFRAGIRCGLKLQDLAEACYEKGCETVARLEESRKGNNEKKEKE